MGWEAAVQMCVAKLGSKYAHECSIIYMLSFNQTRHVRCLFNAIPFLLFICSTHDFTREVNLALPIPNYRNSIPPLLHLRCNGYSNSLKSHNFRVNQRVISRDVNGAGRVRVVVPPYPTRWKNICPVPVSISVGYLLCGYLSIFFISAGIHGYPRVFTKVF